MLGRKLASPLRALRRYSQLALMSRINRESKNESGLLSGMEYLVSLVAEDRDIVLSGACFMWVLRTI